MYFVSYIWIFRKFSHNLSFWEQFGFSNYNYSRHLYATIVCELKSSSWVLRNKELTGSKKKEKEDRFVSIGALMRRDGASVRRRSRVREKCLLGTRIYFCCSVTRFPGVHLARDTGVCRSLSIRRRGSVGGGGPRDCRCEL